MALKSGPWPSQNPSRRTAHVDCSLSLSLAFVLLALTPVDCLVVSTPGTAPMVLNHVTASFGARPGQFDVKSVLVLAPDADLCVTAVPLPANASRNVVLALEGGSCGFTDVSLQKCIFAFLHDWCCFSANALQKATRAQVAGAVGLLVGANSGGARLSRYASAPCVAW